MAQKNDINRNVNEARTRAKEMIDRGAEKAEEFLDDASVDVNRAWNQAQSKARVKTAQAKEYLEDHPWQMAAAGVAVGFLLAAVLLRRRD